MGFVHVYTGNGKGKTTCAVGMAIRAAGAGLPVVFIQFDKGYDGINEHYNERHILRHLPGLKLYPFGLERMMPDGKFRFQNEQGDLDQAAAALAKAREVLLQVNAPQDDSDAPSAKQPQGVVSSVIILDEIITSTGTNLVSQSDVMALIDEHKSNPQCELILTGRSAWPELIEAADLVTEMTLVKHYWYEHKTPAREGIDF